jgi:type II secretory pathway component PulM
MPALSARLAAPPALSRWWATKSAGERRLVVAFAAAVGVALAWLVVWQPVQRDLDALRGNAAAERAALAQGERTAAELAGLARTPPARPAADGTADLERVLAERGLRAGVTELEWKDGRARVSFAAVRFDQLIGALDALQREARLRVVEATLTARVDPGTVRAELVLAR